MASILRRWTKARPRQDMREGDPYLESLVRQLNLLGGGETFRRSGFAGRRI